MKKFIAILLSALLVVSAVSVFASAESTNILAGKSYELSGCGERTSYYADLTDGVFADNLSTPDNNANWFGFYCNGTDESVINAPDKVGYVIFDLEGAYDIDKVRANIISNDGWGIPAPAGIAAYVSDDGETWTKADDFSFTLETGVGYWTEITGNWTAKFLKVEFTLAGTFAFVNEIEAYGVAATADEESSDASSEESSEEVSSEESSEDVSSDAPAVEGIEDELKELVGEANEAPAFDLIIDAPETYEAGDSITVKVTVDNIASKYGIDYVKFILNYDETKLVLTNDLDEKDQGNLICVDKTALDETWEGFTIVNSNFKDLTADDLRNGVDAVAVNDGIIDATALTASLYTSSAKNGEVVFNFTFDVKEDATGDIGIYIAHDTVKGGLNEESGLVLEAGNGGYAIIADANAPAGEESSDASSEESSDVSSETSSDVSSETSSDVSSETSSDETSSDVSSDETSSDETSSDVSSDETSSDDASSETSSDDASSEVSSEASSEVSTESSAASSETPVKPGDASNMIIFAIVALVALAGSAVVIKSRR